MKTDSISKASIAGFFITAITVVILPLLVIPAEHRSEYFWFKILWVEVLAALAWGYLGGGIQAVLYSAIQGDRSAAVIPALGITVFSYIGLSLMILLSSSFASDNSWVNRYHLALQIFITFLFLITNVGLYTTAVIASRDSKTFSSDVKTPEQLAVMLNAEESRLSGIAEVTKDVKVFIQSLKSLREKISYSLPSIQIIGDNPQYLNFVRQVNNFIDSAKNCSDESAINKTGLRETAESLSRQVDVIAASSKK